LDPGSGKNLSRISVPDSELKKHRMPDPDPQPGNTAVPYCMLLCAVLENINYIFMKRRFFKKI
jgi:hypothetical protein